MAARLADAARGEQRLVRARDRAKAARCRQESRCTVARTPHRCRRPDPRSGAAPDPGVCRKTCRQAVPACEPYMPPSGMPNPVPTLALETVPAQTVPLPRTAVGVAHFRTTARNLLCRAGPDTMAAAVLHCATYPRQALTVPNIHWACKEPVSPSLASGSANQNVVP